MPSLKLSSLFRRGTATPTLRERAASLRARIRPSSVEPQPLADGRTATVEEAASLDFTAYSFDFPTRDPNGWLGEFAHYAIGMHISDRTLRMSKPELVAFIREGGERDADVPGAMLAALTSAQKTFEGWGKLLNVAQSRYLVAASSAVLADDAPQTESPGPAPQQESPPAPVPLPTSSLVELLDLASASMDELQTIRDVADRVGSTAYAHAWRACCHLRTQQYGAPDYNDAGKLMQWIGDALTAVETAAEQEAQRRVPNNRDDRETRLSMLAVGVIDNGDPEAIEELACELLAHAKVERGEG